MKMLTPFRRRNLGLEKVNPFDFWMRDFFENGAFPEARFDMRYMPLANVAETEKDWVVSMELPGMDEKDVEVRLNGKELVVSGERKEEKETKDKQFHRTESSYGMFERRFELPGDVRTDAGSVDARFHKGMLEIHVAKVEPKPVTKIPVKSD
jgi:HSP20 family protein